MVKYFAYYREAIGKDHDSVQIDPGSRISDLVEILRNRYPNVFPGRGIFVARNFRYADLDETIMDGDVIAIMPHVSGG
nr:MoaD/ThiS family protein [Thermoplasma sp.]